MLDKKDPLPLYLQIKKEIKGQIKGKKYEAGQMIPSESELMNLYGVSRMTVRLAIDSLEKEGYVKKIQGKGTFVRNRKIVQELTMISSWSESLRSQGMNPETFVLKLEEVTADAYLAEQLGIREGAPLYYVERIKTIEHEPIGWARIWIIKEKAPGFLDKQVFSSVYDVLENEYGIEMTQAVEVVEALAADDQLAELLKIPKGDPLLEVTRVTYDSTGDTVEISKIVSRADRYAYQTILHGRKREDD